MAPTSGASFPGVPGGRWSRSSSCRTSSCACCPAARGAHPRRTAARRTWGGHLFLLEQADEVASVVADFLFIDVSPCPAFIVLDFKVS
jgi:hypothetical protein